MKITRVEAIPFAIPTHRPFAFAGGSVKAAEHVLVRVRTDEGLVGEAEAAPRAVVYGETQASVVAIVFQWLEPAVVGLDPFRLEQVHAPLRNLAGNHSAEAAFDVALHRHHVPARRGPGGHWFIDFSPDIEAACRARVATSVHLKPVTYFPSCSVLAQGGSMKPPCPPSQTALSKRS